MICGENCNLVNIKMQKANNERQATANRCRRMPITKKHGELLEAASNAAAEKVRDTDRETKENKS